MRAQAGRGVCVSHLPNIFWSSILQVLHIVFHEKKNIFRFYKDFTTKQLLKNVENIFPEKIFFNKTNGILSKKLIQTHTCLVFTKASLRNMK